MNKHRKLVLAFQFSLIIICTVISRPIYAEHYISYAGGPSAPCVNVPDNGYVSRPCKTYVEPPCHRPCAVRRPCHRKYVAKPCRRTYHRRHRCYRRSSANISVYYVYPTPCGSPCVVRARNPYIDPDPMYQAVGRFEPDLSWDRRTYDDFTAELNIDY